MSGPAGICRQSFSLSLSRSLGNPSNFSFKDPPSAFDRIFFFKSNLSVYWSLQEKEARVAGSHTPLW